MAIADEITRLQTAKSDLKTSINAKTDAQNQITNELIDDYADFVDSIQTGGGDIEDYFLKSPTSSASASSNFAHNLVKKFPPLTIPSYIGLSYAFYGMQNLESVELTNNSDIPSVESMFRNCAKLQTAPLFDTSKISVMTNMFYSCSSLTYVPQYNTSNATMMDSMFRGCSKLETMPQLDTSNALNINYMFYGCSKLATIPRLNFSMVTNISNTFTLCKNLVNVGGFQNLGRSFNTSTTVDMAVCTLLTEQSLINILNDLYDLASASKPQSTINLGATNLEKLTSPEGQQALANAQAKGWNIS